MSSPGNRQFETDIALVISNLGSGGAQRVLTILANYWAQKGRRICVITYADIEEDFFPLYSSVRRIAIPFAATSKTLFHGFMANLRRIIAIRRTLQEADAKVILSFVAVTNIRAILASLSLDSKVIVSERNDPQRQSSGWIWDRLRQLLYRWADVVTANSHGTLEAMRRYVPEHKLALVPNPIEPPALNARKKKTSSTILNVGSLTHQKAHDILLKAFACMSPRFLGWKLAIVGDGKLRKTFCDQAESLGISDRVDWHGQVRNVYEYYDSADIFVLPSRYEGMPNALLEAMSCGLPAIVSDASPGPLEYVKHGVTGLVAPVDDAPALAAAIERLIDDPPLRCRLGIAARERVAECSLASVIRVWEEVLGLPGSQELTTEGHGTSRAI